VLTAGALIALSGRISVAWVGSEAAAVVAAPENAAMIACLNSAAV